MISLKDEFVKQGKKLSRRFLIPLIIFIAFISFSFWVIQFHARMDEINSTAEIFIRDVNITFFEIEYDYNHSLASLLTAYYEAGYGPESIQAIKSKLFERQSPSFELTQVNFYRISEDFRVFDTDAEGYLDMDLSSFDYFETNLSRLKPGEVFLDRITTEIVTGDFVLVAYVRDRDGTFFSIGLKFGGDQEIVQALSGQVFTKDDAIITMNKAFSDAERNYFQHSLESGRPVFRYIPFLKADYYIAKNSNYGNHKLIVTITYIYPLFMLISTLIIIALIIVLRLLTQRHLDHVSHKFSGAMEIVERNVTGFHLTGQTVVPEPVRTDILEIHAISNAFSKMKNEIQSSYEEMTAMNEELEAAYLENQDLLSRLETLINVPDYLLYLDDIERFLVRSFERILTLSSDIDFAYVLVIDEGLYKFLDSRGFETEQLNKLKLIAGKFKHEKAVVLREHDKGDLYTLYPIPEVEEELRSISQSLVIPIRSDKQYYGSITLLTTTRSTHHLTHEDHRIAAYFAAYLKGYLMIKEFSGIEEELKGETIYALIRLLEKHDPYTKGHSEGVAKLASNFALFMGLSEETAQDLYWAGIIHDMGKILIPHRILNKPGRLTDEEFDIIKKHPVFAYDVLKENKLMKNIAEYIVHHHEKYNGNGYPDGLKGEAIPFEARILTLADSWDAMTAERVYKKSITFEDAIDDLEKNAGIQFDPELTRQWIHFVRSDRYKK